MRKGWHGRLATPYRDIPIGPFALVLGVGFRQLFLSCTARAWPLLWRCITPAALRGRILPLTLSIKVIPTPVRGRILPLSGHFWPFDNSQGRRVARLWGPNHASHTVGRYSSASGSYLKEFRLLVFDSIVSRPQVVPFCSGRGG